MKSILNPFIPALFIIAFLSGCLQGNSDQDDSDLWTQTPAPSSSPTATIQWFPPTATLEPLPTAQIKPTDDLKPGVNVEIFSDVFDDPVHWTLGVNPIGSLAFGQEDLTVAISQPKGVLYSLRDGPVLDNFELEIASEASLCKGPDNYGLLIRADGLQNYYRYSIACNGSIRLDRIRSGITNVLYNWTPSGQVPPGAPVSLKLGVWALGHEMRFFINDTFQFSANDAAFTNGRIGVFARSMGNSALTISFSNLVVHSLNLVPGQSPLSTPTQSLTLAPKK